MNRDQIKIVILPWKKSGSDIFAISLSPIRLFPSFGLKKSREGKNLKQKQFLPKIQNHFLYVAVLPSEHEVASDCPGSHELVHKSFRFYCNYTLSQSITPIYLFFKIQICHITIFEEDEISLVERLGNKSFAKKINK